MLMTASILPKSAGQFFRFAHVASSSIRHTGHRAAWNQGMWRSAGACRSARPGRRIIRILSKSHLLVRPKPRAARHRSWDVAAAPALARPHVGRIGDEHGQGSQEPRQVLAGRRRQGAQELGRREHAYARHGSRAASIGVLDRGQGLGQRQLAQADQPEPLTTGVSRERSLCLRRRVSMNDYDGGVGHLREAPYVFDRGLHRQGSKLCIRTRGEVMSASRPSVT